MGMGIARSLDQKQLVKYWTHPYSIHFFKGFKLGIWDTTQLQVKTPPKHQPILKGDSRDPQ